MVVAFAHHQEYAGNWIRVRENLDNGNPGYCRYATEGQMEGYEFTDVGLPGFRSHCEDRIDCTGAFPYNP